MTVEAAFFQHFGKMVETAFTMTKMCIAQKNFSH